MLTQGCFATVLQLLLLTGSATAIFAVDGNVENCKRIPILQRKNCGFDGITSEQCRAKGCCFDSSVVGDAGCFYQPTQLPRAMALGPPHQKPSAADGEECKKIPTHQRINCGFNGITRQQCHAKLCCFDSNELGVIWCFKRPPTQKYPKPTTTTTSTTTTSTTTIPPAIAKIVPSNRQCRRIPTDQRVSCGSAGITRRECRASGCCFDRRVPDGGIQCFTWSQQPSLLRTGSGSCYQCRSDAAQGFRRCGGRRITERRCTARGCCWLSSEADVDSANVSVSTD